MARARTRSPDPLAPHPGTASGRSSRPQEAPVSEHQPTYPSEDVPDDVDLEQPAQDPTPDLPEED